MIGDAVLREVVGADFFGTLARPDLRAAVGIEFGAALLFRDLEEAGAQDGHGAQFVLQLRTLVLADDHHACGFVCEADGSGVLLHVLPARTASLEDFHLHVRFGNVNFHIVHFGQHCDGGGGGVDAPRRFGGRHALDAMHARLVFQFRVSAFAFDLEDDFLVAADADGALGQDLALPILAVGVARVHAEQVGGEERGLVPARARADFHEDVFIVARVLGDEQGFDLGLEFLDLRAKFRQFHLGQRLEFRFLFGIEQGARFLVRFHRLAIFARLLNNGFQVNALLVEFGRALVVPAHFEQFPVNLLEAFFNSRQFIEHTNFLHREERKGAKTH